jgi:hypothetical protein
MKDGNEYDDYKEEVSVYDVRIFWKNNKLLNIANSPLPSLNETSQVIIAISQMFRSFVSTKEDVWLL